MFKDLKPPYPSNFSSLIVVSTDVKAGFAVKLVNVTSAEFGNPKFFVTERNVCVNCEVVIIYRNSVTD